MLKSDLLLTGVRRYVKHIPDQQQDPFYQQVILLLSLLPVLKEKTVSRDRQKETYEPYRYNVGRWKWRWGESNVCSFVLPVKHSPVEEGCIMSHLKCQTPSHWQMPGNKSRGHKKYYYTIQYFKNLNYGCYYGNGRTYLTLKHFLYQYYYRFENVKMTYGVAIILRSQYLFTGL